MTTPAKPPSLPAVAVLDTNVILRYLTQDNADLARRAYNLFQQAREGKITLVTSEAVIAEVVHILSSKVLYNLPRSQVRAHMTNVLTFRGLKVPYKRAYLRALDLYATTNLDFVDAVLAAHAERLNVAIASFDRDFDKVPGISRYEPV